MYTVCVFVVYTVRDYSCLSFVNPLHTQADNEFYTSTGKHNKYGYVAYFAVLVIWEIIPTYMIVVFFRVRLPSKSSVSWHTVLDSSLLASVCYCYGVYMYMHISSYMINGWVWQFGRSISIFILCSPMEPPLTTTSKEQPHAIKRPRTQVRIETVMTSM